MPPTELSPFQKEKLRYYFKFIEPNKEQTIDIHTVDRLMERVYAHTKWPPSNPNSLQFVEAHTAFYEALFAYTEKEGERDRTVGLEEWYRLWSSVLSGHKGMNNLPIWLRLMPKVLFNVIDRNGDRVIDTDELADFYREMVHVSASGSVLEKWSQKSYASMTDNGHYPLNGDSFEQVFANFLFGRTPEGPGKFIFGCFKHDNIPFQLIQPDAHDAENNSVGIHVWKEKRPRKFDVVFT